MGFREFPKVGCPRDDEDVNGDDRAPLYSDLANKLPDRIGGLGLRIGV